jgi:hypothetical protein
LGSTDLSAVALAAVRGDRAEGVEVAPAGARVARGRRTAGYRAADLDHGVAEPHVTARPRVLFVRRTALDLEQHAETPAVKRLQAGLPRQLGDRLRRDERERLDVDSPCRRLRLHELDRPLRES